MTEQSLLSWTGPGGALQDSGPVWQHGRLIIQQPINNENGGLSLISSSTDHTGHVFFGGDDNLYLGGNVSGPGPWVQVTSGGSLVAPNGMLFAGQVAALGMPGDISTNRGGGAGTIYFGGSPSVYLHYSGSAFSLDGGQLTVSGILQTNSRLITNSYDAGWANNLGGNLIISGDTIALVANGGIWWRWWAGVWHNFSHGVLTEGEFYSRGRLTTNNWDAGWSNNLGGNLIVNGVIQAQGRLVTNGWDVGWSNNLNGNTIINGQLTVQSGYIYCSYINTTADVQAGAPVWVAGQNGDGFLRWYPKANVVSVDTQASTSWAAVTGGFGNGNWSDDRIGMWCQRTGYAHCSMWIQAGTDGSGVQRMVRILRNGGVVAEGWPSSPGSDNIGGSFPVSAQWWGWVNAGDYMSVQALMFDSRAHYNGSAYMALTIAG